MMRAEDIDLEWVKRVSGVDLASSVRRLVRVTRTKLDHKGRTMPLARKKTYCTCGSRSQVEGFRLCHECRLRISRMGWRAGGAVVVHLEGGE